MGRDSTRIHKGVPMRDALFLGWSRAALAVVLLAAGTTASAQIPGTFYLQQGTEPPGAIGAGRLLRGGPVKGFFQPVEVRAPAGVEVSLVEAGDFEQPQPAPRLVGLLIGGVYRLRVTGIRGSEGMEVYPTIEIIDRTYAPEREAWRFPIPVEMTQEDLELALEGKFVTRVIYLEDPDQAVPAVQDPNSLGGFDVPPGTNVLEIADRMGRPVAILRLGGRLPDLSQGLDQAFIGPEIPWIRFHKPPAPAVENGRAALRPFDTLPGTTSGEEYLR
jgi:hypothetical protein